MMRHSMRWLFGCVLSALVLSACGFGVTDTAEDITGTGARLTGRVGNTTPGTTDWWFEYGKTTSYDSSTPRTSVEVTAPSTPLPVSAIVGGLDQATTYHYRICTKGADNAGVCGADASFTTNGSGSVSGGGVVVDLGFTYIGAGANASSLGTDGAATGIASIFPSLELIHLGDEGPVTCLNVIGNRATVGFIGSNGVTADEPRLLFIEDNGPTGDVIGFGTMAEPYSKCPAPTDGSFVVLPGVPGVLTSGDFTVQAGTGT